MTLTPEFIAKLRVAETMRGQEHLDMEQLERCLTLPNGAKLLEDRAKAPRVAVKPLTKEQERRAIERMEIASNRPW